MRTLQANFPERGIGTMLMLLFTLVAGATELFTLKELKTSCLYNPTGLDERPVFSWELYAPNAHDVMQRAYRITVSTDRRFVPIRMQHTCQHHRHGDSA